MLTKKLLPQNGLLLELHLLLLLLRQLHLHLLKLKLMKPLQD
jgi:hypothetical protein